MSALLRQVVLLAVAGVLSWWLLLNDPLVAPRPAPPDRPTLAVTVLPQVERGVESVPTSAPASDPPAPTANGPPADEPAEETPPPPERGVPEGRERKYIDATRDAADGSPDTGPAGPSAELGPPSVEVLMGSGALLAEARAELSGELSRGFETTFLARPEDQLAIARAFGEELVLVPRGALEPRGGPGAGTGGGRRWFRLSTEGEPLVQTVDAPPPLERFRQYRDLFAYEYARLPRPLRELRRSVLSRSEVTLFAALIPPSEWALVIGRRRAALERAGRRLEEVRRFVLRYVRRASGGFDVEVREIQFSDGGRFVPAASPTGG